MVPIARKLRRELNGEAVRDQGMESNKGKRKGDRLSKKADR